MKFQKNSWTFMNKCTGNCWKNFLGYPLICTILFGLSYSPKLTLFRDLISEIIEFEKVMEKEPKIVIFSDFSLKYLFY